MDREYRYLLFIRECLDRIASYVPEKRDTFLARPVLQDAIGWRLQAVADAARNHLSEELKSRHGNVRWRAVYGFRIVAAHQHADIKLDLVWEIATEHLAELRSAVTAELRAKS